MSDAGAPPPPPPGLTPPPPGYPVYPGDQVASARLRRVGGLRTAITIVLGVNVVGSIITVASTPGVVNAAEEFLGNRLSEDEFLEELAVSGLAGLLTLGSTLAIVVLSIIWLYRIVSNHKAVGRVGTWGPGWAIGGWFVPPVAIYVVPMLVLRESWKASDPTSADDDGWRRSPVDPMVYVWWVLYGLVPIVFIVAGVTFQRGAFSQDGTDLADSLRDSQGFTIAQGVVGVLQAVAWALVVRGLTARHSAFTGETSSSTIGDR